MPWPITHRSTNLEVDFFYLQRVLSNYMFGEYNSSLLDDEQEMVLEEIIDEGYRQACYPPLLPPPYGVGIEDIHQWSWMRPTWRLTTRASQRRYPLPQDWDRPVGNLCYVDTANDFYTPIQFTSASRLRGIEYQTNFTSYPQYAAIEPAESTGESPQTNVLVLHPTPDAAYELSCQYQAYARRLTADQPYPLGGQSNGSLILASCLAVAELRKTGEPEGAMWRSFMQKLASAIARDRERGAALLGYNAGQEQFANSRAAVRALDGLFYSDVTYSGGTYDGT